MTQLIAPISATTVSPLQFESNLSPDALMVYLSTRLNGIDQQINSIFNSQQDQQKVQSALRKIQTELAKVDENKNDPNAVVDLPRPDGADPGPAPAEKNINSAIEEIRQIDPHLAHSIEAKLNGEGFILWVQDGKYKGSEVPATKQYIEGLSKDLEADAQMNMIHLQSLMSSRQTAIQLSTNLISALGESSKAIAANIGR
jgi:hypothetical protein